MTDDDLHSRINETLRINNKPRTYDPQAGDVLEWEGIKLRIKRVTAGGEVLLEEIGEREAHAFDALDGDQYAANDTTPLGVQTWATMDYNPTPEDLRRMLRDGWSLETREWGEP